MENKAKTFAIEAISAQITVMEKYKELHCMRYGEVMDPMDRALIATNQMLKELLRMENMYASAKKMHKFETETNNKKVASMQETIDDLVYERDQILAELKKNKSKK